MRKTYQFHEVSIVEAFSIFPNACFLLIFLTLQTMRMSWIFTKRNIYSTIGYIVGLILLDKYQNPHGIAQFLGQKKHDAFTHLLSCLSISAQMLLDGLIQVVRRLPIGNIIIDDVIIEKPFSKKIHGCALQFDHCTKKHVYGQRLVVIVWNLGFLLIPIAFDFWYKKGTTSYPYKTKNEIAFSLLKDILARGVKPRYVLFDSWYASESMFKFLQNRGFKFVTRFKSDRSVIYGDTEISLDRLTGKLKAHYSARVKTYLKEFPFKWHSFSLKGVLLKKDTSPEPGKTKFIVTNEPLLKPLQIVKLYRSRWNIEVFFRDTKQHLGLKTFSGRTEIVIRRHICFVFLTYAILSWLKLPSQSIGDFKRLLQKESRNKETFRELKSSKDTQCIESFTLQKEIAQSLGMSSLPSFSDIRNRIAS